MRTILIATGDEITQGDIFNTTGPAIARQLVEHGITIVRHVAVPDNETAIQTAIEQALHDADVVFTTGGLGPTSDDLTRYALAKALKRELIFDDASWDYIVQRLTAYKLHVHEDNRRQAYFPEGAEIFENPNGTARGCGVTAGHKSVFMLPGPPNECLPMFTNYVLPKLPRSTLHKLHWLLIGASEGEIAASIDKALQNIDCQTGYRFEYPYLEIKVWTKNDADLKHCEKLLEPIVQPYLVSKENKLASLALQEKIALAAQPYQIYDAATGGILQSLLTLPGTQAKLIFINDPAQADIAITGLTEFWQGRPAPGHSEITLRYGDKTLSRKLYYRNATARQFVAEWACWQMLNFI